MKKRKTYVIRLSRVPFERISAKLSRPQRKRLQASLRREIRGLKDHFTRRGQGWNVDWGIVTDGVISDVIGHSITMYMMAEILAKVPCEIVGGGQGLVLRKKRRSKK